MENSLFDPYGGFSNLSLIETSLEKNSYHHATPEEFYSWVFRLNDEEYPDCPIQVSDKEEESYNHKPNPIGYCKTHKEDEHGRFKIMFRDTFFEDLKVLQESEFAILNGVSYFGRRNLSENAGRLHALIFDIDGITPDTVDAFFGGVSFDAYPRPSAVVLSGGGMHLYYIFSTPINLYPETKIYVKALKYSLTKLMWNKFTSKESNVQQQGINQGFRVPGGKTGKYGNFRLEAFISSDVIEWNLDDLSQFVESKEDLPDDYLARYKESKCTLEEAKEKYPQWYKRVILKEYDPYDSNAGFIDPNGLGIKFFYNRGVYDWWKNKIKKEAFVGNRYKCIMFLAVFAMKCHYHKVVPKKKYRDLNPDDIVVKKDLEERFEGVTEEEFKADAAYFQQYFNALGGQAYPFTVSDMEAALEAYDSKYVTYPRKSIQNFSGLDITPKSKRNKRVISQEMKERGIDTVQKLHLQLARNNRDIIHPEGWGYIKQSRKEEILSWIESHPEGRIVDCTKDLNVSRTTVVRYWPEEKTKKNTSRTYTKNNYSLKVQEYRKKYPLDSIAECVRKTGLSRSTVRRYWTTEI